MIDHFQPYNLENYGYLKLPDISISDKEREVIGAPLNCSNLEYLKLLVKQGFNKVLQYDEYIRKEPKIYEARIKTEIDMFENLSFIDYVLLINKVSSYCQTHNIFVDYGRGSCVASTVFYCLGITNINPIRYGLFFERFVSEARAKKKIINNETWVYGSLLADADLNVEPTKRPEIIEYLKTLYPNRVCRISNLSELSSKVLIKEVSKVIEELNEEEVKSVSDMIPTVFGINHDLEKARKEVPAFEKWCGKHEEIYNVSLKLRNLYKHFGVHASGYIISSKELNEVIPLQTTSEGDITSSYTMNNVSSVAVKLDLLSSTCSTIVKNCCDLVGLDWKTVNVDSDPAIYDVLQSDDLLPMGLFQIAADTNLKVVRKIKPKNLSELSDVVAIARPGALSFLDKYCENKKEKIHPLFDPILAKTRYICIYQETMMQLAGAIGFSLSEAEVLRKIVGKKLVHQVQEWKEKIYKKCEENNIDVKCGDLLWKILEDSASYSFNKAHSVAFGALAALTVYLKYKHPKEFYLAILQEAKNDQKPLEVIAKTQQELKYFGIELLPPHLLKSNFDFTIEGDNIRFGLSSVKGISSKTIEKLINFRKEYSNKFELFEAAANSQIPIGVLAGLIQAGAMDEAAYKVSRSRLVLEAQIWNILTDKEKIMFLEWANDPEQKFNYDVVKMILFFVKTLNEKGKPMIKDSRFSTIKKNYQKAKEVFQVNSKSEKLANFFYERYLCGFSFSGKLFDIFKDSCDDLMSIQEAIDTFDEEYVTTVGIVMEAKEWVSKNEKKTKCAKLTIEDENGAIECLFFNNNIDIIRENCGGKLPKENDIIAVRGRKKKGQAIFVDNVFPQTERVFMKHSELRAFNKEKV